MDFLLCEFTRNHVPYLAFSQSSLSLLLQLAFSIDGEKWISPAMSHTTGLAGHPLTTAFALVGKSPLLDHPCGVSFWGGATLGKLISSLSPL